MAGAHNPSLRSSHLKQKELVKSWGRELRRTDFSVIDQFPKEILEGRRCLFPVRKKFMDGGFLAVDKFYVNDPEVTPWLYWMHLISSYLKVIPESGNTEQFSTNISFWPLIVKTQCTSHNVLFFSMTVNVRICVTLYSPCSSFPVAVVVMLFHSCSHLFRLNDIQCCYIIYKVTFATDTYATHKNTQKQQFIHAGGFRKAATHIQHTHTHTSAFSDYNLN